MQVVRERVTHEDGHEQVAFIGQFIGAQKVGWLQIGRRDILSRKDDFADVSLVYCRRDALRFDQIGRLPVQGAGNEQVYE